jgi:hypothetical protein
LNCVALSLGISTAQSAAHHFTLRPTIGALDFITAHSANNPLSANEMLAVNGAWNVDTLRRNHHKERLVKRALPDRITALAFSELMARAIRVVAVVALCYRIIV